VPTFQKLISLMSLRLVYLDKVITFSLISFVWCSFFSISLTQISCGVGGLAWITRCCLTQSWGEQHFPLKIPFLFFVLACLIAVIGAVEFSESYKSLKRILEILIFFWAVNCIQGEDLRERLSLILIFAATVSTFTGFYSTWGNGMSFFYNVDYWINHGISGSDRVEGTMSVYMTYAGLLMLAFLMAFCRLLFVPQKNKWLYLSIILLGICLLLTFTRQAWLGVVAGVIFLIGFRQKILLWFVPIILGFIFLISPFSIQQRINSLFNLNDQNLQIRLALWQGGWLVFKDHPIIGCGFKCIDSVHQNYPDPTGVIKRLRGLHNNFVQLAVDTGLFGLVSWISIWVVYFMTLYRRVIAMNGDLKYKSNVMASMAAVLGFLVAGFFETNFYDSEVSMLLYFIMALPFTVSSRKAIS
tara:strand:- start:362 stop:1600 length:1239 start_codon:yes stop_codon:yes gene_type:complete